MKKLLAMVVSSTMILASLAGCASSDTGSSSDAGAGASSDAAVETADGGEIVIGTILTTSGEYAQYGIKGLNGAMLYIDEVNANGGVNGKEIKVVSYDDKGQASEAIMLFDRLEGENISGVIGSALSGVTIALADVTSAVNMPQITPSATANNVTLNSETGEVRDNIFRACFIDPFQGEKMAAYASEVLGATTAAVIYEAGNDYSEGLYEAFVAHCAEIGIDVVSVQAYSTGDKAFQAQLTAIASQAPDCVFAPNYYEDMGLIMTQARQAGIEVPLLGGDGWAGVSAYASAEDLEGSFYCSGFSGDAEFEAAYVEKYGTTEAADMFGALGYDSAMIMVSAIEEVEAAGGLTPGSDEYKQAVIDAIKATSGLQGLTGMFEFDENNNPIKSTSIIEITDGVEVFKEVF